MQVTKADARTRPLADIEVTVENAVAVVTLNRPAVRNAMTLAMWTDVARLFRELGSDEDVRAVILTGAGGNFSVGADISEFAAVRGSIAQSTAYEVAVDASSDAIADAPKPTIAVVDGYCLGGGCHLAMACDFRFAGRSASFGIPAARLSIVYGLRSTQRMSALVGIARAKRILFSAERFDATEAVRIGFADVEADDPMHAAKDFAATLADKAPLSIAGAKFILNGLAMGEGTLDPAAVQAVIDAASESEDYAEGRRAFAEKRRPAFKGR
jgi:enoyl-CoA hydratase/carnithine racemase